MNTLELKVGDEVGVSSRHSEIISTVTRETRTCWAVNGILFHKHNGRERGGNVWYSSHLFKATPEKKAHIAERIKRYNLVQRIKVTDFQSLHTDTLIKINALLPKSKKTKQQPKE